MGDSKERIQREIEAKKKKLEELKKKRQANVDAPTTILSPSSSSSSSHAPTPSVGGSELPSAEDILSSISSLLPKSAETSATSPSAHPSSSAASSDARPSTASKAKLGALSAANTSSIDIPGAEKILYEIGVQADGSALPAAAAGTADERPAEERENWLAREADLQQTIQQLKDENVQLKKGKGDAELDEKDAVRELKASEREETLASPQFQEFFTKSTKMIERALSDQDQTPYDFTVNYSDAGEEKADGNAMKGPAKLKVKHVFTDVHHTNGRAITSIDWSPKYKELILSSYAARDDSSSSSSNDSALGDPDGTVCVWNLHLSSRPEYTFHCSSAVLSATFHPTHPRLIIGACWSGQIVIWDTREKSTPIARSSLAHGHTQPVQSMSLHSPPHLSGLAHLITLSQDGLLCVWEENNLHKPIHENLLKIAPNPNAHSSFSSLSQVSTLRDEISAYSFDFPGRDPSSSLLLGSDEGLLYKAKIYEKDGIYETIAAHEAPITSVQFHPMHKSMQNQLSASAPTADIFLTSSYDWTIKLWSNKLTSALSSASFSSSSPSPSLAVHASPLLAIENGRDYVYDVRWHPRVPYVFASVDGSGTVDLFNLLDDNHDVPCFSLQLGDQLDKLFTEQSLAAEGLEGEIEAIASSAAAAATKEPKALSRLRWSEDGRMLAVGTSVGSLHILDTQSELFDTSKEQINQFFEKLNNLHAQAQTANILNLSTSSVSSSGSSASSSQI